MENTKCLIDNWSLEYAARLLDCTDDVFKLNDEKFKNAIGGLSNYINSLLLYSSVNYPQNGFEGSWLEYDWFAKNTKVFITPLDTELMSIDWHNDESYNDNGIQNYLITSQFHKCDLYISPERSTIINSGKYNLQKLSCKLSLTLKNIDERINSIKSETWYNDINIGVTDNFMLPSLTQYVLSQATNIDDLLTVIMQLKSSGKIDRIKGEIYELTSSTKGAFKFQRDIENIVDSHFGKPISKDWSISVSAWFLSLSKSFNFNYFNRREHIVFLKDILKTRAEVNTLEKDILRIFKRRIK